MTRQKDALDAAKTSVGSPLAIRVLAAGVVWLLVPTALLPGSAASAVFGWIAVVDMIALHPAVNLTHPAGGAKESS